VQGLLRQVDGTSAINTPLSKARRALRDGAAGRAEAAAAFVEALALYDEEVAWRQRAAAEVGPALAEYDAAIRHSIGARLQERLAHDQATTVAACMAHHRDLSLSF
jgi:predicted metal-dependent phosphoesterase TrpH